MPEALKQPEAMLGMLVARLLGVVYSSVTFLRSGTCVPGIASCNVWATIISLRLPLCYGLERFHLFLGSKPAVGTNVHLLTCGNNKKQLGFNSRFVFRMKWYALEQPLERERAVLPAYSWSPTIRYQIYDIWYMGVSHSNRTPPHSKDCYHKP